MAKKKPVDAASEFISDNEYLKKIMEGVPSEQKDNVLSFIGEGVLRQSDYSRMMDQLNEKDRVNDAFKGSLDTWYGSNLKALEDGVAAQKELAELKKSTPAAPATGDLSKLEGYIKKDEVEKLVSAARAQSEETGLQVFSHLANLTTLHLHKYGEPIDAKTIIAEARKNGTDLDAAFRSLTAEKETKLAEERDKKKEADLRKSIEAELRQKMGNGAYPVGAGDVGVSPVLGKLGAKSDEQYGVQAALDEYYKMSRPGASS